MNRSNIGSTVGGGVSSIGGIGALALKGVKQEREANKQFGNRVYRDIYMGLRPEERSKVPGVKTFQNIAGRYRKEYGSSVTEENKGVANAIGQYKAEYAAEALKNIESLNLEQYFDSPVKKSFSSYKEKTSDNSFNPYSGLRENTDGSDNER